MSDATITSKGQITIPKGVRESLHLCSGDRVDFHVSEDGNLVGVPMNHSVREVHGCLYKVGRKKLSDQEIRTRLRSQFASK